MLALVALCSLLATASALPGKWYRDAETAHPVHSLFSRQTTTAPVGSAEWKAKFPTGKLDASKVPQAWLDALNKAVADGRIPSYDNVPVAAKAGSYKSKAGKTLDPSKAPICSSTVECKDDTQIYDVPDGVVALSFDDGPLKPALELQKFLRAHNQTVTHFYIGSNVLENPDVFKDAFEVSGDDIAVHTWSHPQMTTLTNEMVVAELGWTCQIIHDSTGGRLPLYWRPPYGDSDSRVRAIASEIFGLKTVIWNDDTNDWKIPDGTNTLAAAKAVLTKGYNRATKSPGLNILEHELAASTVQVFTDTYPLIAQNGWVAKSIPDAMGTNWYLNAKDNKSPVVDMAVGSGKSVDVPAASSTGGAQNSTATGTNGGSSAPTSTPASQTSGADRLSVSSMLGFVMIGLAAFV